MSTETKTKAATTKIKMLKTYGFRRPGQVYDMIPGVARGLIRHGFAQEIESAAIDAAPLKKKRRGRPPGSKNKPKVKPDGT